MVNPVERGHIAFRTDDIAAFKQRLDEKGIRYSDYGGWAMTGWQQIFFYDPDGNVIEVHQAPHMTGAHVQERSFSRSRASASFPVALAFSRNSKKTSERWIGCRFPAQ